MTSAAVTATNPEIFSDGKRRSAYRYLLLCLRYRRRDVQII